MKPLAHSPPLSRPFERVPFSVANVDDAVAFSVANGSPHDSALIRRLMCRLTSAPEGVLVWRDALGLAVVATVVDQVSNGADATTLEILGARRSLDGDRLAELVIDPGVAFARRGPRRALHIPLYPWLVDAAAQTTLEARGFALAYTCFTMGRLCDPELPGVPRLEPGFRWAMLDEGRIEEAHRATAAMFAGAPSASLSPLEDFRRVVVSGPDVWRVLLDGERIAAMVRLVRVTANAGKIGLLGRVPAYRGRGIGPQLVAEGLRVLSELGVREVTLDVEAENDRALDLYQRFGFEVVVRTPVWEIALTP
jgi:ribosomal protein S18 acetylase RimI-like enzyme